MEADGTRGDLAGQVAVVGDVVASRTYTDQSRLLLGLAAAVADLTAEEAGARSAGQTIGDEFQALFDDVPTAVLAVAGLRLRLLDEPPADRPVALRVGIGVGAVSSPTPTDAAAPGQSGPGWWAAREALEFAATERRGWPRLRWWIAGDGDHATMRATLIALDTIQDRFDAVDVSLARGLLRGRSASALAGEVGMSRQSVSARLRDHGVYGWVRTLEAMIGRRP